MTASGDPAHTRLVEIDAADYDLTGTGWRRQTLKCLIGDEACVDAAEGIGKSLQQGSRPQFPTLLRAFCASDIFGGA
jgi:hypothetical protein